MSGGYRPRPYLPAVIGPLGSLVLAREFGEMIEGYIRSQKASPHERNREAANQLEVGLESMRECARQLQREAGWGSDPGTAELVVSPVAARSRSLGGSELMSAQEVATECRVSDEYVRRLCRDGTKLRGRLIGGSWHIEAESVKEYQASRRPVA